MFTVVVGGGGFKLTQIFALDLTQLNSLPMPICVDSKVMMPGKNVKELADDECLAVYAGLLVR